MAHPRRRNEEAVFVPVVEQRVEPDRGAMSGSSESRIARGFDRVREHPFAIDPARLVLRSARAQQAGPHFHCFFNQVILPGMFERREQIIEIGCGSCGVHLPDNERHLFAVRCRNSRLPFAVRPLNTRIAAPSDRRNTLRHNLSAGD